jgi:Putative DNA-binding domain
MSAPINSPSLAEIFQRLNVSDILAFVADHRWEDLTLDFKLAPSNFANRDDRRTLATAISGFANSGGGLIVWGINARKDAEEIDSAQQAEPLTDGLLFMSRLVEHAGNATAPVVDRVQHRLVEGNGGPFALTLVPESDRGPHMAKLGENRYYKRSGDSFYTMEHFDIADMFGRRRKPALTLTLEKERSGGSLLVFVTNVGRGIARAPYLAMTLPEHFRVSGYGFDGHSGSGLRPLGEHGRKCCFGADAGVVIHVGQALGVTRLDATVQRADGSAIISGRQTFRYELAAEDLELTAGEVVVEY